MLHKELSYQIIGCCIRVHKGIGPGLLEQCYHNALYYELKEAGFMVGYNVPYTVKYKGNVVGEYLADLVVNNQVILELKSVRSLGEAHKAQLINYLHISGCELGYLLNFQNRTLEFERLVVSR
ncbi:MAG TPA: GxxExxY protein [Spirochaeta sp.]|nr:GxxExxY protein [Spirochaeta sp.]